MIQKERKIYFDFIKEKNTSIYIKIKNFKECEEISNFLKIRDLNESFVFLIIEVIKI